MLVHDGQTNPHSLNSTWRPSPSSGCTCKLKLKLNELLTKLSDDVPMEQLARATWMQQVCCRVSLAIRHEWHPNAHIYRRNTLYIWPLFKSATHHILPARALLRSTPNSHPSSFPGRSSTDCVVSWQQWSRCLTRCLYTDAAKITQRPFKHRKKYI